MATLTLRVSALTCYGKAMHTLQNMLVEKIALQGLCELLTGE